MPSSWSASVRFELQFTGENINLWGDKLNTVLQHVDYTVAGWLTKALTTSPYVLTIANAADDEARAAMLKFTGTGAFTVTIPSVSKSYDIWNACTGVVTISTGAGTTVDIDPNDVVRVICDGSNVKTLGYDGYSLKDYITAFTASAGAVPSPIANAGKYLYSDGANVLWRAIVVADVTGAAPSAAPTITGGMTLSGGLVFTGAVAQNVQAMAALSIDWSVAEVQTKSISGASAFTFTGFTASKAQAVILDLTISGAAVPTWPASVKWSGGVNPSASLGNGRHILGFLTDDGGTTVVGFVGAVAVA